MSALTWVASMPSPTVTDPVKSANRPRTLARPRWRTEKLMALWAGSMAQVPSVRGCAAVVVVVIVGVL